MVQTSLKYFVACCQLLWRKWYLRQIVCPLMRVVLHRILFITYRIQPCFLLWDRVALGIGKFCSIVYFTNNRFINTLPVVYILAFAPQLLESSLTLLHRHRVIEVPRGILPLFVRNGRTSKRVIVIGINAPILRHLLSSFLFSLAVSFFFFFLFKLVYYSVDSCKAFSFGAFRKILQRILQVYRFGVRRQFVENLCTLRQLFVVFAVFVQQTKGFVIATAGIAELFLCPIQVAKA